MNIKFFAAIYLIIMMYLFAHAQPEQQEGITKEQTVEFLNKKLGELEKRFERLKDFRDPSDTHRNALTREIERSRKLDESLIQELLVLEGSLKK